MSILNYFFIGFGFTFMIECIINWKKDHPRIKSISNIWKNDTRTACILVWPLALLFFILTFLKEIFRK